MSCRCFSQFFRSIYRFLAKIGQLPKKNCPEIATPIFGKNSRFIGQTG
jgi:hypothetical protein